jgi:hypothetical protein
VHDDLDIGTDIFSLAHGSIAKTTGEAFSGIGLISRAGEKLWIP